MPHTQVAECGDKHCFIHQEDEQLHPHSYQICFECNHVYQTAGELITAYNQEITKHNLRDEDLDFPDGWKYSDLEPLKKIYDPNKITFCPLCLHDF